LRTAPGPIVATASASMTAESPGAPLYAFAAQLYPICRSITGNGVRKTLDLIGRRI